MYALFGDEIAFIYTNIAAIVCITLSNMVPNRREVEIQLESTEESLAMKEAFVRYLSHEMRTPINVALVGLLMHEQDLKESDLLTDERNDNLTDVKGAVNVALETLNEALNYEKLQSKVMKLEKTKEDPLSFVLSSTSMFKASALNAGVSLILPQATDVVWPDNSWIDIDLLKMSQVMRNFISNALKFSSAGGSITVAMKIAEEPQLAVVETDVFGRIADFLSLFCREKYSSLLVSDPWLEISVKDDGVGIEPEYLPRIFNEVLQINPNKNQGGKETGMGLYISKGFTELNGGRVEVHSDGLGQGSCFKILLPLHIEKPALASTTTTVHEGALRPLRQNTAQVSPLDDSDRNVQIFANDSDVQLMVLSGTTHQLQRHRGSRARLSADTAGSCTSSVTQQEYIHHHRENRVSAHKGTSAVSNAHDIISDTPLLRDDGTQPLQTRSSHVVAVNEWITSDRLSGRKVLMVDDSPTNLKMCVKLLKRLGAEVDKAEDGRLAVEMVQQALLPPEQQEAPPSSSSPSSHTRLLEQRPRPPPEQPPLPVVRLPNEVEELDKKPCHPGAHGQSDAAHDGSRGK